MVLTSVLCGAASVAILLLAPLLELGAEPLRRARPLLAGLAAWALALLLLEWLAVH